MRQTILLSILIAAGIARAQVIASPKLTIKMENTREIFGSDMARAKIGNEGGGGGDIACDAKIRTIADNIHFWIQNRGPEVGSLNLATSVHPEKARPYTLPECSNAMLNLFRLQLNSSCVTPSDPGYPVKVGDTSKICVTTQNSHGLRMKCDQVKFLALDPDSQIQQIHHEFAINLPGLEPVDGPISSYRVSQQLSAYTRDVLERKLTVTPGKDNHNSTQSHYKMLKDAFDKAGSAKIEDFLSIADFGFADKLNFVCAFVWGPEGKLVESYRNRFGRVNFRIPSQGPLFPEQIITAVAPAMIYNADFNSTNEVFAHFFTDAQGDILINTFTNGNGDLQTNYVSSEIGQKQSVAHFVYRKQGNLLYARGLGRISLKDPYSGAFSEDPQIDMYGYCYPATVKNNHKEK